MYRLSWNLEVSASWKPQCLSRDCLPLTYGCEVKFPFLEIVLFLCTGHVKFDVRILRGISEYRDIKFLKKFGIYLPNHTVSITKHRNQYCSNYTRMTLNESFQISSRKIIVCLQSRLYELRSNSIHFCRKEREFWVIMKLTAVSTLLKILSNISRDPVRLRAWFLHSAIFYPLFH